MLIIVLLGILIAFELVRSFKNQKILFNFSVILVFSFSALRIYRGLDDDSYIAIYNSFYYTDSFFVNNIQEPLFQLILKALSFVGNANSVFLLSSAFSAFLFYKINKRLVGYSILPLIVYLSHKFIHNDMNQIRQGAVSLGFLFLAINYRQAQWFKGSLLSGIHILSTLYFPAQFFSRKIKLNRTSNIILLIAFVFILRVVFKVLIQTNLFEGFKLAFYIMDSRFNQEVFLFKNFTFIKSLLIFTYCKLFLVNLYNSNSNYRQLLNIYFLGILVMIIFQDIEILSGRVSSFFFITEPFLFHFIYNNTKVANQRILFIPIILFAFMQTIFNLYYSNITPIIF